MAFMKKLFFFSLFIGLVSVMLQHYVPETVDDIINRAQPRILQIKEKLNEVSDVIEAKFGFNPLTCLLQYQDLFNQRSDKKDYGYGAFKATGKGEIIITKDELKKYDGVTLKKIYIGFLGLVFDVTKAPQYYGPDGGYKFFAGRDASRAFVTGQFEEAGLIDNVEGLSHQDYLAMEEWLDFYKKEYKLVGRLIGRYYTIRGEETEYKKMFNGWVAEAKKHKMNEDNLQKTFPPCNSEWTADTGSRFWCTKKSGGIERTWEGVPRQLFTPGKKEPRCACIKNFGDPSTTLKAKGENRGDLDHPHLKEFANCPPQEHSCHIPKTE